jgi:5S rRNA maturation endonuclease (ribonuclease M5)
MFKTKNLVHDIKSVPSTWIFEHFCDLKDKLAGVDIKIKSVFNPKERTASMCIYVNSSGEYRFKDFSTGKGGCGVELVKLMNNINYHTACRLIVEKYNDYVLHNNGSYDVEKFIKASKYRVTKHTVRKWSTQDQYFWTQFNIGTKLLTEHRVVPLEHYTLTKDDNDLKIKGLYLYGYFKEDGTLYKIYQPKTLDKKFIKVANYVQGWEQLGNHSNLIITSSLKDVMSIKSLKLNIDVIAPDSENTIIKNDVMEELDRRYDNIILLYDNDEPGIEAMKKFKEKYPINKIKIAILPMSKDVSDSIKDSGAKEVRNRLVPILDKKITVGQES